MPASPVVIVFGGSSSERLVSVASGQNVSAQLPAAARWFIAKDGAVHVVSSPALSSHERAFERELTMSEPAAYPSLAAALEVAENRNAIFFLALHGGEGENGTVQSLLEERGVAFTGSGSKASETAFDKTRAKTLVGEKGAKLAPARVLNVTDRATTELALRALFDERPRWVLKPVSDGSSTGLVHLRSVDQISAAVDQLVAMPVPYLAEAFIEGRELTVGVIDEGHGPVALPVSEVRLAANATFDYAGKYLGKGTEEVTPALLAPADREAAQSLAVLAHQAVGCEGYSRTDMILSADGPVFLEINTLPGLTKASFIPQQLAAAGTPFRVFLEMQITLAERRAQR